MSAALPTRMVERPWGREELPAPFVAPRGQRIGEVWFEPPAALDQLLVKYIFTSQALSVQVHPSDVEAPEGHRGKDECWLVIAAEPGARIGVGFSSRVSPLAMREAALDGSIERLLDWHEVAPGDFFSIPAGTVHAIGAGVSLIEVQQNSDITYRLYDYGRGRELHLDAAVAVARGAPHPAGLRRRVTERGLVKLVEGPRFRLWRCHGAPDGEWTGACLAIPLDSPIAIGGETVEPGGCALAPNLGDIEFGTARCLIARPL